jgi:hypothetical protein
VAIQICRSRCLWDKAVELPESCEKALDAVDEKTEHSQEPPPSPDERNLPATPEQTRLFCRTDWLCFGLTVVLALTGYLLTLAPDVTLEFSGIFSTGAMYAGVPHPPGYPLWTLYAWLFTVLLPFSNIAWRVAVSSAVAGALACGMIALMVSRGGAMIAEGMAGFSPLQPKEERAICVVSGCVAGLALGFDGGLWRSAVVVHPWPLSLLLFSIVLCLLMRWIFAPDRRRYLYAAAFVYGLTFSNSQALFGAAFGLQVLVMLADRRLVRELCLANSLLFGAGLFAERAGFLELLDTYNEGSNILHNLYFLIGIGSILLCVALIIRTRRVLSEWKAVALSGFMFLLGLTIFLYTPLASMTNPPVNWAYARTAEGFVHLLTRGQYERIQATTTQDRFSDQLRLYAETAVSEFGALYLLIALVPFCFFHRMRACQRGWILGLFAVYVSLVILLIVVLNPLNDRESRETCKVFFSASHLVLALWTGYGLTLIGVVFGKHFPIHAASAPTP